MLYQINEVYIKAGSEKSAFLKYAGYCFETGCGTTGDIDPINPKAEIKKLSRRANKEYFMPIFEKVQQKFPGSYFDDDSIAGDIVLILDENDAGKKVAFVLMCPETFCGKCKGLYTLNVGIYDDEDEIFTILTVDADHFDNLIDEIKKNAAEYFAQL